MPPEPASDSWQDVLKKRLPLLGHRNWIVVTDAAYPMQISPGIETIIADGGLADTTAATLQAVRDAPHVLPIIHVDAELEHLSEEVAPGTGAIKAALEKAFSDTKVQRRPHEDIIAKLDAAGRNFKILLIKTNETIPYTSVFVELACGYWNDSYEAQLRDEIKASAGARLVG